MTVKFFGKHKKHIALLLIVVLELVYHYCLVAFLFNLADFGIITQNADSKVSNILKGKNSGASFYIVDFVLKLFEQRQQFLCNVITRNKVYNRNQETCFTTHLV